MRPDREGIFAKLRAEAPVSFHAEPVPPPEVNFPQGPGFWALTRYADVMQVSRDPDTFHSAPSINIGDIPPEIAEWLGSMINMDAPKHTKLRLIVNRGFTPRQVAKIEENVRPQAREIVDHVVTLGGECDFVSEIAAALPLQIICDMLGIPAPTPSASSSSRTRSSASATPSTCSRSKSSWPRAWSCSSTASSSRRTGSTTRDDITTTLMQAEVEDENGKHKLTPGELGSFFLLLVVAGQRDDAHRDQPRHVRAHAAARPAPRSGPPTSTASPLPRSKRSCAGRHR